MHRLLAQNRELIAMVHKLMSQVHDKHATRDKLNNDNLEPMNETWMLHDLSSAVYGSSGFGTNSLGTNGPMDFASQIFDNSNAGFNNGVKINSSTVDSFFGEILTTNTSMNMNGNVTTNMQHNNNNNVKSNLNSTTTIPNKTTILGAGPSPPHRRDLSQQYDATNPFVPQLSMSAMYKPTFNTSVETTFSPQHNNNNNNNNNNKHNNTTMEYDHMKRTFNEEDDDDDEDEDEDGDSFSGDDTPVNTSRQTTTLNDSHHQVAVT